MNYLNVLKDNIRMSKVLHSKYDASSMMYKGLTYHEVCQLTDERMVKTLELFSDSDSAFLPIRYILSCNELKEKILACDNQEHIEMYKSLICELEVYKTVDASDLAVYDTSVLESLDDIFNDYCSLCKYSVGMILNYCAKKGLGKSKDDAIRFTSLVISYINNLNRSDTKGFIQVIEYALTNNFENIEYDAITKLIKEEISDCEREYIQFLSKNKVSSYNILTILKNNDTEKRLELLKDIEDKAELDIRSDIFSLLDDENFSNKEINTLLYKLENNTSFNLNELNGDDMYRDDIYSQLLALIYPNFKNKDYDEDVLKCYHYSLQSGKKKFLKMILDLDYDMNDCLAFSESSVYEILNLNNLALEQIDKLNALTQRLIESGRLLFLKKYASRGLRNISLREFELICSLSIFKLEVYEYLIDLKPDDRMRLILDLPDLKQAVKTDKIKKIANLILEKSLSKRILESHGLISNKFTRKLSRAEWCLYFIIEDMDTLKKQVRSEMDMLFFIEYEKEIRLSNLTDFEEIKRTIYLNSEAYKQFITTISAGDKFMSDNEEKIYEFFLTGEMLVFLKYAYSLSGSYLKNLIKITKAELSNKLKDIKFYKGDLAKEIGYDISEEKEEIWKNNLKSSAGKYISEECDDYETVIKMGEIPVSTCMSYAGGSYNHCLLSNFDANKKIIIGSDKNGAKLGRAVLRLTKISDTSDLSKVNTPGKDSLRFRDVEYLNNDEEQNDSGSKNEELVLFLEKCYTSANDGERMRYDIFKLAYIKAQKMGVRLMVANDYMEASTLIKNYKEDTQAISNSYIYISKSKNGSQYLDSFGGNTTNDSVKYMSTCGNTVFLQENMFDSIYEEYLESITTDCC